MPNKTLTVNLDPKIEAKLSGFFDGLTANLRIVTEEYERVLCCFQKANKAKREARRELANEKQWRRETTEPFLAWAQSYLNSGRWAGHDMFDAIKTELLERDAECNRLRKADAVAAEREECAQVAVTPMAVLGDSSFDVFKGWGLDVGKVQSIVYTTQRKIAAAIHARGAK